MAADTHKHLPRWHTIRKSHVYHTRIFDLESDLRREDETNNEGEFYLLRCPEWINVIAVTTDNQLVLVEQYRHGTEAFELEIVGGIVEPNETPAEASLRELREETGYVTTEASRIEEIGFVLPNPAFLNNRCYTFLVTNVALTSPQQFDEHENIAIVLEPLEKMHELVSSGHITHGLVINAFYWYERWQRSETCL